MKPMKIKRPKGALGKAASFASKNRGAIYAGIGIGGFFLAYAQGVQATPKALIMIEEEKRRINHEYMEESIASGSTVCRQIEDLSRIEKFKTCWKVYAPSALTLAISSGFVITGYHHMSRSQAALAAAYEISRDTLSRYRDAAKDIVPEETVREIENKVSESKISEHPVVKSEVYSTGNGDTLCWDCMSARYFKCSVAAIRKAESHVNRMLSDDIYCSLNEFYTELGLPETKVGDNLGWEIGKQTLNLRLDSRLTENDEPALVLDYEVAPQYIDY